MTDSPEFISYAQHGEDVVLWRALGARGPGFYVDVGAFHPSYDSVTRALYERGWRGINIEPQPDRIAAFTADRPDDRNLNLAIGDRDGTATLRLSDNPGWATISEPAPASSGSTPAGTIEVTVRRLDSLFAELGVDQVDVLKIDVEGTEAAVVRGLLDGPVRPLVCVVEGVAPETERTAGDEAVELLVGAGYVHCLFDGLNHYLTTDPDLQAALSIPANPMDSYTTDQLHRLLEDRRELIASIEQLSAENLALRAGPKVPGISERKSSVPDDPEADQQTDDAELHDQEVLDLDMVNAGASGESSAHRQIARRETVDPSVRAERRRATFGTLIRGQAAVASRAKPSPLGLMLRLVAHPHAPADAVAILYREILGRDVDPGSLTDWTAFLEAGASPLAMAHRLASSSEAQKCPAAHRARVKADLAAWEHLVAASELGLTAWHAGDAYRTGTVADEIFVASVFEVALRRPPTPGESQLEVSKLAAGVGREWIIRAYAARPEARSRFLGTPGAGLASLARRWRYERQYLETFRRLVEAAEARQIALVLNQSSSAGSDLHELDAVIPPHPGAH